MADTETELKLSCRPEDLDTLVAHPLLRSAGGRKPVARRQISRYFDTEDDALARAGLSLRIRVIGRKTLQTVKTKGTDNAGFSARGEWEAPIDQDTPDPALFTAWGLEDVMRAATEGRPLVPRFETDVIRATRIVKRPAGEAEIAVDRGVVRTTNREEPINEVELELKYGARHLLHDLALELLESLPLGLGGPSKAARGYRLLGLGPAIPPSPAKADTVPLRPDMTSEHAFLDIARSCLNQLAANAPVVIDGTDPEGVHQGRVAIRRLRSAMAAFRPIIDGPDTDQIRQELRWLMGLLGPARDADVFREEVLPPLSESLGAEPGWDVLVAHFDEERADHAEAARQAFSSDRFTALIIAALRWLEAGDWRRNDTHAALRAMPLGKTARAVLRKRMNKALESGADFDTLPEEARHALRIQVKKARYTLDFLAPLYPAKEGKAMLKAMKRVQDILGQSNDITVGRAKLRAAAERAGTKDPRAAFVAGWAAATLDRDHKAMEVAARTAWATLSTLPPVWESGEATNGKNAKAGKKSKRKTP